MVSGQIALVIIVDVREIRSTPTCCVVRVPVSGCQRLLTDGRHARAATFWTMLLRAWSIFTGSVFTESALRLLRPRK